MRISPLDLQQKRFSKVFRGLNENQVYPFLDMVREEFEDLLRENSALRQQVQWLETDMQKTKEMDSMVWNFISRAAAIKLQSSTQ